MKTLLFVGAMIAALVLGTGNADAAHQGAVSPCCADADGDSGTTGDSCNEAEMGAVGTSGCVEHDSGSCVGGTLNGPGNTGPAGCVCVSTACATADGPAEPGACTAAAADACCDSNACH